MGVSDAVIPAAGILPRIRIDSEFAQSGWRHGNSLCADDVLRDGGLQYFSESVSAACYSVVSQPGYVKKALFDLEVIPFSSFGSSLISGGIWLAVAMVAGLMSGRTGLQCLWLPILLPAYMLFCCGCVFLAAAGSVFLRDLPMLVQLLLQGLFFLCPIIYPVEIVPAAYQGWIRLNPLSWYVESIRGVILNVDGVLVWPALLKLYLAGGIFFLLGFLFFAKTKRGFADVL